MKKATEGNRAKNRALMKEEADRLYEKGEFDKARLKYVESISITSAMVCTFMNELKKINIECIVAPYEADAQLAYFSLNNIVSLIITEDSDLLAYGCRKVFFKMDNNGNGYEIDIHNLKNVKEVNLMGFSQDMFLTACIMSGCDYLDSIKGIGFKTACELVRKHKIISAILTAISAKYLIPPEYSKNFAKAFLTFKYQVVYSMVEKRQIYLHSIELNQYPDIKQYSDKSFLGTIREEIIAQGVANGLIDPTKLTLREESTISDINLELYAKIKKELNKDIYLKQHDNTKIKEKENEKVEEKDAEQKKEKDNTISTCTPACKNASIDVQLGKPEELQSLNQNQAKDSIEEKISDQATMPTGKLEIQRPYKMHNNSAKFMIKKASIQKEITPLKKPIKINEPPNYIVSLEKFKMVTSTFKKELQSSLVPLEKICKPSSIGSDKITELENFRFQPNMMPNIM